MRTTGWGLILGLLMVAGVGQAAGTGKPIKIIAIGDSITEAYRVIPQAYRFHLAKLMDENDIAYDFVGSKKGVLQNPGDGTVDLDHEGYSGWKAEQVIPPALKTAQAEKPDVALVHLGTNDILFNQGVDNAVADIQGLIKSLKESNPKIVVFLGLIPSMFGDVAKIEELNERLKAYAPGEKNVYHVEMRPFPFPGSFRDKLHPNEAGAKDMAGKWFAAMDQEFFNRKPVGPATGNVPAAEDRELRIWTSTKGTTVEARLLKTESRGTICHLARETGERLQIGVSMLSPEDQSYVKGLIE